MKIRTGDSVLIIAGKDKGKTGRVMRVLTDRNRVLVEGINIRTRHIRRQGDQAGQRVQFEGALSLSNVMLVDPKTKKPTRVGYVIDPKTGRKDRITKKSKEIIKGASKAEAKKESGKKTAGEKAAAPAKKAFWERGSSNVDTDMSQAKGQKSHIEHGTQTDMRPHASRSDNG